MNTPLPPVSAVRVAAGPGGRGWVVGVDPDVVVAGLLVVDCFAALPPPEEEQAAKPTSAAQATIIERRVIEACIRHTLSVVAPNDKYPHRVISTGAMPRRVTAWAETIDRIGGA